MYTYTTRNGQRVEVTVAAAFDRLAAAFKARFGLNLLVSSGTRTNAEQWALYRAYKTGRGNLAAYPGTSNHEENGPRGPRAIDVRDSGGDAGVTVRGTVRANWLKANASKYGFNPAGYGFSQIEPWHIEFTGALNNSGGGSASRFSQDTANRQAWLNKSRGEKLAVDGIQGPLTTAAIKRYQVFLGVDADGQWGPKTQAAHQRYYDAWNASTSKLAVDGQLGPATIKKLQAVLGVAQDGQFGPETAKALQKRLGVAADGQFGVNSTKAMQKVIGATQDGQWGAETTRKLQEYLNNGGTFSTPPAPAPVTPSQPSGEPKLAVDGQLGPETIKALQKSLGVTADGEIGPITITAMQKAMGITQDGLMGPHTVRNLQANVGAGTDGQWGTETTRKLQEFLNAGKKLTKVVVLEEVVVKYPQPEKPTYPEAVKWGHSSNSSPRTGKIDKFIIHHQASTSDLWDYFMGANGRKVSPNWEVMANGDVREVVPPDNYRAWTSGQIDHEAVTVETQNTTGAPNWGISEDSMMSIAKLVAWASKRYGFPIDRAHIIGHKDVPGSATACPGPSMDIDWIITQAKALQAPVTPVEEEPNPNTPDEVEEPTEPSVPSDSVLVKKSVLKAMLNEIEALKIVLTNLIGDN